MATIFWKSEPEGHDYPAALSYLKLCMPPEVAEEAVALLREKPMEAFKAKDIFRASGLEQLDNENSHVLKNLVAIDRLQKLSPILLVVEYGKLLIADGYHRMCAVYQYDEDALIPCKIVYTEDSYEAAHLV